MRNHEGKLTRGDFVVITAAISSCPYVVIPNSGDFVAEEQPEAFMAEFRHFFSE